ncbi:chromosome partitioning protein ParB [Paracoccus alkanivorans]|uniref:Chromosome partitioning protein ParB n=1 Tax=Paracoccus alkanivorans TaxID=2116655 RepID=A0A3M0M9T4_9RHOB|nr:chromosome partitioning protein ParB [Paracoccus alkanivorans]
MPHIRFVRLDVELLARVLLDGGADLAVELRFLLQGGRVGVRVSGFGEVLRDGSKGSNKDLGIEKVECLISTDDEAFTYNKRISRLSPVQEHKMILRAIERGVPEEKIAKALDINPQSVRRKVRMLDGISEETVAILKDKPCPMAVFEILRKMRPLRQIEAAELLVNANNYSVAYASAILAGTPQTQLAEGSKPKHIKGITPEAMARMENELARLQESITSIQETYGQDHLQLTVIKSYLGKLLGNARVVRYLMQHRPEFLDEFQAIAEMTSTLPPDTA